MRASTATTNDARDPIARAVEGAIALWDERLFFEVHEVLEAVWQTATGDVRQALQGVIQLAVAFYHLDHGNRRGARSLLSEGRSRLGAVPPDVLPGLDLAALRDATATCEARLGAGETSSVEPPPLHTSGPRE
jgi:predicted metal-dependent hydrolase